MNILGVSEMMVKKLASDWFRLKKIFFRFHFLRISTSISFQELCL